MLGFLERYGILQGYLGSVIEEIVRREFGIYDYLSVMSYRSLICYKLAEDMMEMSDEEFMEQVRALRESRVIEAVIAEKAAEVAGAKASFFNRLAKKRKW